MFSLSRKQTPSPRQLILDGSYHGLSPSFTADDRLAGWLPHADRLPPPLVSPFTGVFLRLKDFTGPRISTFLPSTTTDLSHRNPSTKAKSPYVSDTLYAMSATQLPNGYKSFGPKANCTLEVCPLEASLLRYQPSIPVNGTFIGLFALAMIIHTIQGLRSRNWGFMASMIGGCLLEIIGYVGRLILHDNPFSFGGFLLQISKPVFRLDILNPSV